MAEFRMPSLGADMEAGTLVEWLVRPGDLVKRGDVVAVVETQKGAIEIEIFETGKIDKFLVDIGAKVPVGTPLARVQVEEGIEAGIEAKPVLEAPVIAPPAAIAAAAQPMAPPAPAALPPSMGHLRASPAVRRLAQTHKIDLSAVAGSGPSGAIILRDIERELTAVTPPEKGKPAKTIDLDGMRAAIAAAMARSKREIPHYYLEHQVDVTGCEAWLARMNETRPPDKRLLMGVLALKAVALAIHRFPGFSGFYRDGKFEAASGVHVGVAIAIRGGGLAAPAIHDTDRLSCDELMLRMRDLVQRMRAGRIRGSEIADAAITVSSLGERGVEGLYGVIYPPQVAIVGFGKVVVRPWVVDDTVVPRSIVTITLSGDHRVSDGHVGALFLAEIGKLLQEPDRL
ncbi:MAG TPA: dihydrolipoamide acetyltransferase family protein [Methylocella sp.]|nr:dihydrolipoamide acetyltransferase family protein [Methylocella sp.]